MRKAIKAQKYLLTKQQNEHIPGRDMGDIRRHIRSYEEAWWNTGRYNGDIGGHGRT